MPRTNTETRIRVAIQRRLEAQGFRVIKLHGNRFQEAGLPDLLAIKNGRLLAIEVKRVGEAATTLQRRKLDELARFGVVCGTASSVEEAEELVELFDRIGAARYAPPPTSR